MSPARMQKIESGMRTALAFHAAFNQHDTAAISRLLAETCTFEENSPAPNGTTYAGRAAIVQCWTDFFRTYPQAQREIEEVFGFGPRCVLRWRMTWHDASGQPQQRRGVDIFDVKEGAIVQQLSYG